MKGYIGKHVEFTDYVEKHDMDFDKRQRAKVVDAHVDNDGVWRISLDFSYWEEYNKQFAKANWYDKDSNPTLKWHETRFYPKNCLTTIYYCPGEGKSLFNVVPLKDKEEKARKIVEKVQELIEGDHIRKDFCSNYGLQELVKVMG